jgi:hypothetical protein
VPTLVPEPPSSSSPQIVSPFPIMSSTPTDAAISSRTRAHTLDARSLGLEALNMAKNLREVIAPVESEPMAFTILL